MTDPDAPTPESDALLRAAMSRQASDVLLLQTTRFRLTRGTLGVCEHPLTTVDRHARRLLCTTCQAVLDPYEMLDRLANLADWVARLQRERGALGDEIRKLKTERNSLRSSLNRTRKPKDGAE